MNARRARTIGVLILFVAFLLASANSILASSPSVLDTDPSTYVIVAMLMLFVFIFFTLKERIELEFNRRNLAYGIALFAAYVVLVSFLRAELSTGFMSFRMDALLFPLLLASLVVTLFGIEGIRKMKYLIAYAVFASPLVLLPFLGLDNLFARANAVLVYGFLKLLGMPVANSGLVIAAGSSSITISSTCVSLGIFAALAMFLLPLAYFYDGTRRNKALWFVSGIALLLALNIARMIILSLAWLYYGLGAAIGAFHAVAGEILFYVVIAAMVLIAYKYGLFLGKMPRKPASRVKPGRMMAPAALAIAFGIIAFALSFQYGAAIYAPALRFTGNASVSGTALQSAGLGSLAYARDNIVQLGAVEPGYAYALQGAANATTFALLTPMPRTSPGVIITGYNSLRSGSTYILRNGIALKSAVARSGNMTFYLNYFTVPYNFSGNYVAVNYELFRVAENGTRPSCGAVNATSLGIPNYIESEIYNVLGARLGASGNGIMCESYRIARSSQ